MFLWKLRKEGELLQFSAVRGPMKTFVLLTRLVGEEVHPTFALEEKEKKIVNKIREYLPSVKWVKSFAVAGPWDYMDIFEADDMDAAIKVSALVRYYGAAHTELWPVLAWEAFEKTIRELAEVMER